MKALFLQFRFYLLSAGKEGGLTPFGRVEPGEGGEERLAHLLSEASHLLRTPAPTEDSRSNDDSKSPHGPCLSPFSNKVITIQNLKILISTSAILTVQNSKWRLTCIYFFLALIFHLF